MHSELDELSKGEGNGCASSISQHLRRLPGDERPPYDWAEFRRRAQVGRRTSPVTWRHALLAAGLAAVVMSVALWSRLTGGDGLGEGRSVAALSNPEPGDTAMTPQRQRILLQAEASGRWLASLPAEPAVARFSTRAVVTDLEDRIAWVDELLNVGRLDGAQPAQVMSLQRERARLVNSLAQVRYAESLAADLQ